MTRRSPKCCTWIRKVGIDSSMNRKENMEAGNKNELARLEGATLSDLEPEDIDAIARRMERAAEATKKMVRAAVRFTRPHDWKDFGGTLYLEGEGALRLMTPLGLRLGAPRFEIETMDDDIFVQCELEAFWPRAGTSLIEIGSCDTRDAFYAADKPGSAINQCLERARGNEALARRMLRDDVKKKALMNATSRAITGLLGMRGLKPEDIKELGFEIGKIEFKTGSTRDTRAEAKTAIKIVALASVKELPVGSVVSFGGKIFSCKKMEKFHGYTIYDGMLKFNVIQWSTEPLPGWAQKDEPVFCESVTVKEYQGGRQYVAKQIVHASDHAGDQAEARPPLEVPSAAQEDFGR